MTQRSRVGWLVYLSLITAFAIVGELRDVVVHGAPNAATVANWILSVALLSAAWCYALQRPIGSVNYWRAVFWIVLGTTLVMLVPVALAGPVASVVTAVLLLLVLPAYVAAFRYAYRCPELWAPLAG